MPCTETAMLAVFALVIGLVIFGGTTLAAFAEGRTAQRDTTSPREAEDPVPAVRVLGVNPEHGGPPRRSADSNAAGTSRKPSSRCGADHAHTSQPEDLVIGAASAGQAVDDPES